MKVLLYGGTFDPPHNGHLNNLRAAADRVRPDKVVVMPAGLSPFKQHTSAPGALRLEMCSCFHALEEGMDAIPQLEVSGWEVAQAKAGNHNYTVLTVEKLARDYPGAQLYLAIGSDMLLSFDGWHLWWSPAAMWAMRRSCTQRLSGWTPPGHASCLHRYRRCPWPAATSAPVWLQAKGVKRNCRRRCGRSSAGRNSTKRKYQPMNLKQAKELVRGRLSDKRYEHTLNVKKMAVKLAKIYGEDEERAALAALLHDSAKEISKDEMREILHAYPQYAEGGEERPAPVWHGVCAAILARTQWGVTDEAVLSAIACHTAGKPGMTRLDKILYLADMTSAERDWPGVEKLRKLEKKDLDAAMLAALKQTNDFVLSQGKPLDPMSKAAYEDILACSGQNEREGTAESKGL